MLTSEIAGKEVIGSDGFKLGKIRDTDFDENTWKVGSIEIELEKDVAEEHHLKHRFRKTRVLIHTDRVQGVGDRVLLKGSKEDLLKLIASAASTIPEEKRDEAFSKETSEPSPQTVDPSKP